jgi:hypothetical protein
MGIQSEERVNDMWTEETGWFVLFYFVFLAAFDLIFHFQHNFKLSLSPVPNSLKSIDLNQHVVFIYL